MAQHIIIPSQLQAEILSQLHSNHMGTEKTRLLMYESIYSVNMNDDIENAVEHCSTCLEYQHMKLQEYTMPYEVADKLWELGGTNMFMINN